MFHRAASLLLLSYALPLIFSQENYASDPVDVLSIKHLQISNYNGPLDGKMFILFKNVEILDLRMSNFSPLHDNILYSLPNLKKVSLSNNNVLREVQDVKSCCKKLKEIEFINSGFDSYPWHQIGHEWPLEKISLFGEKIPELKANILEDTTLKHLSLERSGLEKIDDGAFNGVNHLETLNLQGNKIKNISKKTFAPLKTLKELNLSKNLLEEFTGDQIPNLPNLEKLNIGHNPIKKIDMEEIKKSLPKLKTLDVSGIDNIDLSKLSNLGDLNVVKMAVL